MPLYRFHYINENGEDFTFEELFSINEDISNIMSPCGKYKASLIIGPFSSSEGLTARQKHAGTTKSRVDTAKYMKEKRDIRKKNYAPGTRQHDSNEIWTGTETSDGLIDVPIDKTKKVI